MATTKTPALKTHAVNGSGTSAPSISLANQSTTQIPVASVHAINYTAGEEPLYLVRMKDGTLTYIKESLLAQSGGSVAI